MKRLVLIAALLACAGAPSAWAQCWLGDIHGSGTDLNLGFGIAIMGDVNGDGLPDVAANVRDKVTGVGMIRLLAGPHLELISTITSPTPGAFDFGRLAALGDVDGDGTPDVAGASPNYGPGFAHNGRVEIFSGATGAVLHSMDGPLSSSQLGYDFGTGPDIDGDGLPELLATVDSPTGTKIHAYSTATWGVVLSLPGSGKLVVPGDVDLDGVPDIAAGEASELSLFSTATGRVMLYETGIPSFPGALAPIGDMDGDGTADLLVSTPEDGTVAPGGGSAFTMACPSGDTIQAVYGNWGGAEYGWALCSAGDVDGDGMPDLAIGAPAMPPPAGLQGSGAVYVRSSATGELLTQFRGEGWPANFGARLAGPADFNGDGFDDVLEAAPNDGTLVSNGGGVAILSSRFRLGQLVPAEVVATAPVPVELHGAGFEAGSPIKISVAGVLATQVTWVSPELVTFLPPLGVEDSDADVIYKQGGPFVLAKKALKFVGPQIVDVYPTAGSKLGGDTVHILGKHFATDGSTVVQVYAAIATLQSVTENEIVITTPPYVPATGPILHVSGNTGSETSWAFTEQDKYGTPNRGNIQGSTVVQLEGLTVNHVQGSPTVHLGESGGLEAQVLAITAKTMTIKVPPIAEPDGALYNVYISDPVKGNESLIHVFQYTPWLAATFAAEVLGGGHAQLQILPDPAPFGPQFVTAWVGLPSAGSVSLHLSGFAGLLHELPWIFVAVHQPLQALPALDVAIAPYDPIVVGLPLHFQALVTGEGAPKGSFTNVSTFTLP